MPTKKNPGNRIRDTSKPSPKSKSKTSNSSTSKPPSKPQSHPLPPPNTKLPPPLPSSTSTTHAHLQEIEQQQTLLNIFSHAFKYRLHDIAKLRNDIQSLKHHLYNRDFGKAFAEEGGLEAYAVRWSPGRALAYAELFREVDGLEKGLEDEGRRRKIVCIGGGAGAEVVALAGLLGLTSGDEYGGGKGVGVGDDDDEGLRGRKWDIVIVDIAPWASVISKLVDAVTLQPISSPDDASDSTKAVNGMLVEAEHFAVGFQQRDVLAMESDELSELCLKASMVTLTFTLNELYTTSISKTTKLLLDLTSFVEKGCVLLVVDSPGSYSTLALNKSKEMDEDTARQQLDDVDVGRERRPTEKEGKKYPMQWLLDHTLLEVASTSSGVEGKHWEKVRSADSRWFRLREEMKYPIALEDMRMQVHVYRRL